MIFALQIVHELIARASQNVDSLFVSIANAKASANHLTTPPRTPVRRKKDWHRRRCPGTPFIHLVSGITPRFQAESCHVRTC
jgi:hypothetical protein